MSARIWSIERCCTTTTGAGKFFGRFPRIVFSAGMPPPAATTTTTVAGLWFGIRSSSLPPHHAPAAHHFHHHVLVHHLHPAVHRPMLPREFRDRFRHRRQLGVTRRV